MDRRKLGEDREDAPDDRISHSILGLTSADIRELPPLTDGSPPPERPPQAPEGEAADLSPSSSFLHLDQIPLRSYPAPSSPAGADDGAAPGFSFLGLSEDARRPLSLSGGDSAPSHRHLHLPGAEAPSSRLLGLPARVTPKPPVPAASFAHAPVGVLLARTSPDGWREPAPDPARTLFVELDRRPDRAFPVERAILISLVLHLILVLVLGTVRGGGLEAHPGLLAALRSPRPNAEEQFPIVFHEAPGPERANPKRSDFSDRNRIAGGGDRAKPRSDTPFIPELPGKQGLSPGAGSNAAKRPPAGAVNGRETAPGAVARGTTSERRPPEVIPDERTASSDSFRPPAPGSPSGTATGAAGAPAKGLPDLSNVIQREAQNSLNRSGEGGAGIPNPEGGFVDSGPISFETSWYDWGPYAEEMVRRIKLHWDIPKLAELGWKGKLTIHFNIRLDGSVDGATIVAGSGIPPFDFAAMQAIVKSNPFRPLPKDLLKLVPGKTKEGITVTFFYNIRPGREGREGNQEGPPR